MPGSLFIVDRSTHDPTPLRHVPFTQIQKLSSGNKARVRMAAPSELHPVAAVRMRAVRMLVKRFTSTHRRQGLRLRRTRPCLAVACPWKAASRMVPTSAMPTDVKQTAAASRVWQNCHQVCTTPYAAALPRGFPPERHVHHRGERREAWISVTGSMDEKAEKLGQRKQNQRSTRIDLAKLRRGVRASCKRLIPVILTRSACDRPTGHSPRGRADRSRW